MSKILANQIANYGDDAPIEIKEGLNIPAGKPIQAAGSAGTNGQVLTSTGTSIQWTTPFNGDYNALANLPTIPAAQVASDWNATSGVSRILNKPVVPAQPSVVTNAAGTAALSYNSGNGQFTYTPPDLSAYATTAAVANSSNWDTAYGWDNHATAGYLTTEADTLQTVTSRGATTNQSITIEDDRYLNFVTHFQLRNRVFNGTFNHGEINHTGDSLTIQSNNFIIDAVGGVNMLDATGGGAVSIYYNGDKKLETSDEGVTITGSAGNNNLSVYGDALVFGGLTAGGLSYPEAVGNAGQILTSDGAGNVVWGSAAGGGSGIALSDLSVTTNAAGSAALTYNNVSGVFTYTPPDLSSYAQTASLSIANWDAAHGWGNHALAGYASSASVANASNWDTAYSWGDHSTQGYLTSLGDAAGVTTAKITEWDTAYGWGDHSTQGYLTTVALNDVSDVTITTPSNGQVLTYNGAGWVNSDPVGGIANVTISDTAPGVASSGDLWWESDKGRLKVYYQDVDSAQWVDASPPLAQPNVPVAAGFITLNGTSPTWTGTTGYTVSGTQPGGAGTDYVITLTFPTAYSARTDYIVQATYDGTNYISANGAQIAVARGTSSVVFTPRRWDENPLSLGEIMVTITNL